MITSHRIQLLPNQKTERYFRQASGTSRMVWNWALAEWERKSEEWRRNDPSLPGEVEALAITRDSETMAIEPGTGEATAYDPDQRELWHAFGHGSQQPATAWGRCGAGHDLGHGETAAVEPGTGEPTGDDPDRGEPRHSYALVDYT